MSTYQSNLFKVSCEELPQATGGVYYLHSNGTVTFASLNCSDGHVLTGTADLECAADGSWSVKGEAQACGELEYYHISLLF